jgi:hypothetical protein
VERIADKLVEVLGDLEALNFDEMVNLQMTLEDITGSLMDLEKLRLRLGRQVRRLRA